MIHQRTLRTVKNCLSTVEAKAEEYNDQLAEEINNALELARPAIRKLIINQFDISPTETQALIKCVRIALDDEFSYDERAREEMLTLALEWLIAQKV
jgi:hypothetical protein